MKYKKNMTGLEFSRFRVRKDLSQSEAALILGVSVVTVKAWEHQRRNIPLSVNNFIRLSIEHVPSDRLKGLVEKLKSMK
jgi:DNA-binding transcriptional regulator YiaG